MNSRRIWLLATVFAVALGSAAALNFVPTKASAVAPSLTYTGTGICRFGTRSGLPPRSVVVRIVRSTPTAHLFHYAFSFVDGSTSHMNLVSTSHEDSAGFITAIGISYAIPPDAGPPIVSSSTYQLNGQVNGSVISGTLAGSFSNGSSCMGTFHTGL